MTNREWLMNKIQSMSDYEFATKLEDFCRDNADICKFMHNECEDIGDCTDCTIKWLKAEHKENPKLTETEKVILENVDKYKFITRDRDGALYIFEEKPTKSECGWWVANEYSEGTLLTAFNHLFQFISWEDENPYEISELLKGEQ